MFRKSRVEERDACAIIAFIDKRGHSSHANIVQTIDALRKMGHRSGDINGEGDGCGIGTDIPREIWARKLSAEGLSPHLAESHNFFVGHILLPHDVKQDASSILPQLREEIAATGGEILLENTGGTRDEELGPRAREEAPLFWQVGGMMEGEQTGISKKLFRLQAAIEESFPRLHIASLSTDSVIYKVQGLPDLLPRVYPELRDEAMRSIITLGHGRYSTNTLPTVERSQPFSLLGHNGEINTIERLRTVGRALGIRPVPGGSDSQDLNRIIEGLINLYDLDLLEAMAIVFPAVHSEVGNYSEDIRALYDYYRWFFPCSSQGPAAVVVRHRNICLGRVDALGLRPLWFGESDYSYFLSSEKGVVDLEHTRNDPRPLAPGEMIAVAAGRGMRAEVFDYGECQKRMVKRMAARRRAMSYLSGLHKEPAALTDASALARHKKHLPVSPSTNLLAAFGWKHYDFTIRQRVSHSGREVIGSMGHTGPLAAFVPESLPNIADYVKENVAVVTNPAIDRERETEHFSTRVILGSRPDIAGERRTQPFGLLIETPLLLDSGDSPEAMHYEAQRQAASETGTHLFVDVLDFFTGSGRDPGRVCHLDMSFSMDGGMEERLDALCEEAKKAIADGAALLVLDDSRSFHGNRVYLDPALGVARLNDALIEDGLRREASIVVRSAAIRNLHDLMFLLGLGADALVPYMLWQVSCSFADEKYSIRQILINNLTVLRKGIEKVMSTMGIHELCGYGRIFSSIGLSRNLAGIMHLPNFCEGENLGLTFSRLEELAAMRLERASSQEELAIFRDPSRNPRIGKILRGVAVGKKGYLEMAEGLEHLAEELPTGIRHLVRPIWASEEKRLNLDEMDITIGHHAMPLVIAAMSFGSQGEDSFRAYAEAGLKANIVCMNGEGGEIPDMLGRYRKNRGQQLASGRFGVFMGFINSTEFLEIKIGQGAKPGEGGHLPGNKVSEMVSKARHCKQGIALISPSNHHDIYSIEDLAQIITELKTANPEARVSVKIPITSGVGTIAVGIAKAGADIINLSGFEGGTGAAREHAKRFVGLPAEIGISEAHKALLESCLRDAVELWVDGGMRSGADVMKMILLGANRVGMGTVALMGVGCISCERCHLDRCPRGISTQLRTREDAEARGVKGFSPRVMEEEAENLARLLGAIGDELKMHLAAMGEKRLQDLVGRTDLLEQYRFTDRISVADILSPPDWVCDPERYPRPQVTRKPLNYLTRLIADLAMDRFDQGMREMRFAEENVRSTDRAVGTYLAGAIERRYGADSPHLARLRFGSSVPGNGLCAFNTQNVDVVVEGGSQDGAAKGSFGGFLGVFKGRNMLGRMVDGSTGKSFAYGAIGGLLMVQNMADSRACIRMSGADVVFGGRITEKIRDGEGNIACRAHLKGFAFEYMTGGRAVVLGDPGPWICAGMTGGIIYQCLYPEFGFDMEAVKRRLARGANVSIKAVDGDGLSDIRQLLVRYIEELQDNFQLAEAAVVQFLLKEAENRFIAIVPKPMKTASAE